MFMAENLIIIGSGPAGLTAAIYTAREGFVPLLITGTNIGGQLLLTTLVENYPGFPDGVLGPELMQQMQKQAERFGTRFVNDDVTDVDFSSKPFKIRTGEKEYEAECVIIATGASAKRLGLESETRLFGRGVSTCGTCDGPFFKGKDVIVIGGGDTAMEDSLFLTKFANSVTIIHRREEFRASKIMQERVLSNPKIKVIWNSGVEEILGKERVEGARIKNLVTGEVSEIKADGFFLAIGYNPNTSFLKGKLKLDDQGYIITKEEVKTDIEGLFVAGDVSDRIYRQAITAAASGTKAALEAREYLQKQ
jgi:thioredoxin reductase (NADPH)